MKSKWRQKHEFYQLTYGAPVSLLVCYDKNESWMTTLKTFGEDYDGGEMDACIVGTQMMNMATELGLGTLWARGFNSQQIHDAFALPENIVVSFLLDVGYPASGSVNRHTPRKDLSAIEYRTSKHETQPLISSGCVAL